LKIKRYRYKKKESVKKRYFRSSFWTGYWAESKYCFRISSWELIYRQHSM